MFGCEFAVVVLPSECGNTAALTYGVIRGGSSSAEEEARHTPLGNAVGSSPKEANEVVDSFG